MSTTRAFATLLSLLLTAAFAFGCGEKKAADEGEKKSGESTKSEKADKGTPSDDALAEGDAKAYPLTVCIVSDEDLDSMGGPVELVHKGQTIKFCCSSCVDSFKDNPDEYLAKLAGK